MSVVVNGFLSSTSNWVSGLPTNPVTELLQGAFLVVRRALTDLFPTMNPGQTTGQTSGNTVASYYTEQDLRAYLLELAQAQYGSLFGQTVPVYGNGGRGWTISSRSKSSGRKAQSPRRESPRIPIRR